MSRDESLYINDMLESCLKVIDFTTGISKEEMIQDRKTYDAVLWNLQLIGEASRQISDQLKENHSTIEWRKIRAFRNIVTHEYFGIDHDIVWDVIQNHIPLLKEQLQQIKDSENG